MQDDVSLEMLLFVAAIGLAVAFFIGCAMNEVMGEAGFGPFGNMVPLSVGFLLGTWAVDHLGVDWLGIDWTSGLVVFAGFFGLLLAALFKRLAL